VAQLLLSMIIIYHFIIKYWSCVLFKISSHGWVLKVTLILIGSYKHNNLVSIKILIAAEGELCRFSNKVNSSRYLQHKNKLKF